MAGSGRTNWPQLEGVDSTNSQQTSAYTDEYGEIDIDIYETAGDLWRRNGESFALSKLRDAAAGLSLMLRTAVDVTRRRNAPDAAIESLSAYIWRSYKRRILDELEKENEHRRRDLMSVTQAICTDTLAEDLDKKILIQQIEQHMEDSMYEVYQYLVLGFDFSHIGEILRKKPRALKKRFDRQLKHLIQRLKSEHEAAGRRSRHFQSLSIAFAF